MKTVSLSIELKLIQENKVKCNAHANKKAQLYTLVYLKPLELV